jgi:hypothetical protein
MLPSGQIHLAYNEHMQIQHPNTNWIPLSLRLGHPLVQHHLRQPVQPYFRFLILIGSGVLFLLFGGLSLPMLYLLLSLLILIQLAAGTAERVYRAQEVHTWDLIRVAPFSRRDILLSMWAAGVWQLNRIWMVSVYWVLHGFVILGVIIFGLWFGEIPSGQALLVIFSGTLFIALQPLVEIYFSGMVGLMCASLFHDRTLSLAVAGFCALCYWSIWIASILLLDAADLKQLSTTQMGALLSLPLLLPLLVGYAAQRYAERKLS